MKPLRTYVRELADRAGYIAERKSLENSMELRRTRLMASLGITTVLDVGANVGVYGATLRRFGHRGPLVSFEPMSAAFAALERAAADDPLWDVRRMALGDDDGESVIHIAASDPWSSLLETDPRAAERERLASVGSETVRTARLDSMPEVVGDRTWLKLDVQGYEVHALSGAQGVMDRIAAVECEVSLEPFYVGQPTVRELIDLLDDAGFRLAVVDNGWMRENGRARWVDLIFARST